MGLSVKQIERATQLRNSMVYDAFLGNYKSFKTARKEYASLAVQDFDRIRKLPAPKVTVPLFSKAGFNLLYIRLREAFRIKTPDEKLMEKFGREARNRENFDRYVTTYKYNDNYK